MRYALRFTWMQPNDPPIIAYGTTASKAKYRAFWDTDCFDDFGDFLKSIVSCKKITNQPIDMQPSGRPSICIGDTVQMVNCPEAKRHQNKLWKVTWGPLFMCGTCVVWLKDYSGAFACEYLQRIKTQK